MVPSQIPPADSIEAGHPYIWQTNYTDRLTPPHYIIHVFNRSELPPTWLKTSSQIHIGAAQVDSWRVLTLDNHGGVCMDIDADPAWFLGRLFRPDDEEIFVSIRGGDVSNWFFGRKPENSHLRRMINEIQKNIATRGVGDLSNTTGSGVFIRALELQHVKIIPCRISCLQGNFANEYFQHIDRLEGR